MAAVAVAANELGVWERALVADTEDVVTFARVRGRVTVVNVSGAAAVYFLVDSTDSVTVGSGKCYWLPAIAGASRSVETRARELPGTTVVKVRSAGAPTVSVEGE